MFAFDVRRLAGTVLTVLAVLVAPTANAQARRPSELLGGLDVESNDPIQARADKLEYGNGGWAIGRGNVRITRGNQKLSADMVRFNTETGEAHATGGVVLRRGNDVWQGERLSGNFKTGRWDAINVSVDAAPFRVDAAEAGRDEDGSFVLHNACVTTCTNHPSCRHYRIKARELRVDPGEQIKMRHAVLNVANLPCFYLPYWSQSLKERYGWIFRPGYRSRMGAFLLSSYRARLSPDVVSETHIDYRTKRGFAGGQDLVWEDADGDDWLGSFSAYYAYDEEPVDDDEDEATADIDSQRYRVRLSHSATLSPRDYLLLNADFLSDIDMLEDFFEGEYRHGHQPENYASLTHRGDFYTASGILRSRLNDFYSEINRLPEVSFDMIRVQLGRSGIYYEGQAAAAFLEQVWDDGELDREDYSTFRFDTSHILLYPRKYAGFLNIIPRAGLRGTYYSDTRLLEEEQQIGLVTTTNVAVSAGVTNTTVTAGYQTNTVTHETAAGQDFRGMMELGVEVSFKAFKMWHGGFVSPLRHIVEPYADYTLIPEPDVRPDMLYRFDAIDTLDKRHTLLLGMRNKYQTKVRERPYDLVDVDIATVLDLDPDDGEAVLEDLVLDAEFRWPGWISLDFDAVLDLDASQIERFNGRLLPKKIGDYRVYLEYRYRVDTSSLIQGDVTYYPNQTWSFNAFSRYQFEGDARLEEIGGTVRRNLDCVVMRTGLSMLPGYTRTDGSEREDELKVIFEMWLTAFPDLAISSRE